MFILKIIFSISLLITSTSSYAYANPIEAFKAACINNLHDPKTGANELRSMGWKKLRFRKWENEELLRNFIGTGIRETSGWMFREPNKNSVIVFGLADNNIYPNYKCLFVTKNKIIKVANFRNLSNSIFKGISPKKLVGKRYGNINTTWSVGHFDGNISDAKPFNHIILNDYTKVKTFSGFPTKATMNIAVVGMKHK
jgi:hypothetical protein